MTDTLTQYIPDGKEMTFGEMMREARQRKGMSLTELQEATGKHWTYFSKVELGRFPPPAAETIVVIADALGVDSDKLLVAAGKVPPDILEALSHNLDDVKDVRRLLHLDLFANRENARIKKSE